MYIYEQMKGVLTQNSMLNMFRWARW